MALIHWLAIAYFIVLVVLMNWKGEAFLSWSLGKKLLVAFGFFIPWALYVLSSHM